MGENSGGGRTGPLADPAWLAGGAAGLAAAVMALWAFRGLPLGPVLLWLAPMPLFMAGIGFGAGAAVGAMGIAAVAIYATGPAAALWIVVLGLAAPVAVLTAASARGRGNGRDLSLPLALAGILPALGILGAAFWLSDTPGGLEGMLRQLARTGLRRFDIAGHAGLAGEIARIKAAAIGLWLVVAWIGNAWVAGRAMAWLGIAPAPDWRAARLPAWYIALPILAGLAWLLAEAGEDAIELSLMLVLLLPLVLHGLAALHTRLVGRGERPVILGAVYVALVVLFLPASLAMAGYGAFDLISSRKHGAPPRS
ncbi:hypothetical protein [Falsiroseomonas sp. HW251]|uniref:hypothetical protein n=1 Tax=Falsiroseomonas sp. HW251 TaxID=3390998 RepID=UPI003D3160EC